jgi:ATP-dependent helicase/nuclease subunit B
VITPRRTRLVRVRDLREFRRAIELLATSSVTAKNAENAESLLSKNSKPTNPEPGTRTPNPEPRTPNPELRTPNPEPRTPNPAVFTLVPTRSAAAQLARAVPGIDAVTRDELYDRLHARLDQPPRRLSALERDVMAQAAARTAASRAGELAFQLRPGLIAEMLHFYDQLRRQSQQVKRFEELIEDALGSDDLDRAAHRMRIQTRFLADAFREYEALVAASSGCDEHTLRERLIAEPARDPVRRIVVTVADWIAESDGLFLADFDLLTRIPGLETLDILVTERVLASGFDERVHDWLPGVDEERGLGIGDWGLGGLGGGDRTGLGRGDRVVNQPALLVPNPVDSQSPSTTPPSPQFPLPNPPNRPNPQSPLTNPPNPQSPLPNPLWFTCRDREEELIAIARRIRADEARGESVPLSRIAIVFKRPLPYLYAAAEVFRSARIPFQATDALPLAAEPTAAALDLVLDTVASNFTRATLVALLRSPHFVFRDGETAVTPESVSALDRMLSEARYLGDPERLEDLAAKGSPEALRYRSTSHRRDSVAEAPAFIPALEAARATARELAPLSTARPASQQLSLLLDFWTSHLRPIEDADACGARERRARAAIGDMLSALAAVHAAHDDPGWTIADLGVAVRRWIEEHTFGPDAGGDGVQLLDDQAARYGDFDDLAIVGLVETDWPDKPRRNIFYPPSLLKSLGWPSEKDRRAAADARFLDLLASSSRRTIVSTFTLDEDALVSPSMQLDEIPRARLSPVACNPADGARIFDDEALSLDPPLLDALDGAATREPAERAWAELRIARSPADAPEFHGTVRAAPERTWAVSAIETYLDCPFRFFAQHVLKLQEEPEDEEVMDPRRQGQFVHDVFERFFSEWQAAGHRAITQSNLDLARDMFTTVVDRALERLSPAEAGLERTRLLGSPAAAGLGEAVFRMEAERPTAVVERRLEQRLEGAFTFTTAEGPRTIAIKGKADRIDLLDDGTFRLIDYKLGWPPDRSRALQLPIYSVCAEQTLATHRHRSWRLGEAVYLAFKGPKRVVPLFSKPADRAKVLAEAQQRLADTLDAIDRGEFPPTPYDVYRCETCAFDSVCRKDYVGDV